MTKRDVVDRILGAKRIAVAGVSRKKDKFGSALYKELLGKGMDMVAVNPHMTSFMDLPCYPSVEALPENVEALITVVKPSTTLDLVKAAEAKGIRLIWMQQGSESDEAVEFCREAGLDFVHKECVLMYADPVGSIHRFHRGIAKLFGRYQRAVLRIVSNYDSDWSTCSTVCRRIVSTVNDSSVLYSLSSKSF
ncbi:MAG: CoA-binding protein [Spirochaetaceae bacterium]|nr:CoA-binding protein [Spirochaetaceae bacterium]MDT8296850.1 CoA-binding protein [Spirochaetaceae bacterium]